MGIVLIWIGAGLLFCIPLIIIIGTVVDYWRFEDSVDEKNVISSSPEPLSSSSDSPYLSEEYSSSGSYLPSSPREKEEPCRQSL